MRWLLVLINYLRKDIGDFLNLQMIELEDMIKMYKSRTKSSQKAENWLKANNAKGNKKNAVLNLVLKKNIV